MGGFADPLTDAPLDPSGMEGCLDLFEVSPNASLSVDGCRALKFIFPVEPKAVQSVRGGKNGFFQDPKVKAYKSIIAKSAASQMIGKPLEGLVRTTFLCFAFSWPKGTPKEIIKRFYAGETIWNDRHIDLEDNLAKGMYDALRGIVFEDDCLIVHSKERRKIFVPKGYIELHIQEMPKDSLVIPRAKTKKGR